MEYNRGKGVKHFSDADAAMQMKKKTENSLRYACKKNRLVFKYSFLLLYYFEMFSARFFLTKPGSFLRAIRGYHFDHLLRNSAIADYCNTKIAITLNHNVKWNVYSYEFFSLLLCPLSTPEIGLTSYETACMYYRLL